MICWSITERLCRGKARLALLTFVSVWNVWNDYDEKVGEMTACDAKNGGHIGKSGRIPPFHTFHFGILTKRLTSKPPPPFLPHPPPPTPHPHMPPPKCEVC